MFFFHVALNNCHSRYGNKTETFCAYLLLLCKVHIIFSHENEPFWLKITNVEFIASGFYTVCPASRSVKLLPVPSRFLCPFHTRPNNLFSKQIYLLARGTSALHVTTQISRVAERKHSPSSSSAHALSWLWEASFFGSRPAKCTTCGTPVILID